MQSILPVIVFVAAVPTLLLRLVRRIYIYFEGLQTLRRKIFNIH